MIPQVQRFSEKDTFNLLHPASGYGVIAWALSACAVSACMSVCLSHYPGRMDGRTDLNFGRKVKWKETEVKFIDQGHRSRPPSQETSTGCFNEMSQ